MDAEWERRRGIRRQSSKKIVSFFHNPKKIGVKYGRLCGIMDLIIMEGVHDGQVDTGKNRWTGSSKPKDT